MDIVDYCRDSWHLYVDGRITNEELQERMNRLIVKQEPLPVREPAKIGG